MSAALQMESLRRGIGDVDVFSRSIKSFGNEDESTSLSYKMKSSSPLKSPTRQFYYMTPVDFTDDSEDLSKKDASETDSGKSCSEDTAEEEFISRYSNLEECSDDEFILTVNRFSESPDSQTGIDSPEYQAVTWSPEEITDLSNKSRADDLNLVSQTTDSSRQSDLPAAADASNIDPPKLKLVSVTRSFPESQNTIETGVQIITGNGSENSFSRKLIDEAESVVALQRPLRRWRRQCTCSRRTSSSSTIQPAKNNSSDSTSWSKFGVVTGSISCADCSRTSRSAELLTETLSHHATSVPSSVSDNTINYSLTKGKSKGSSPQSGACRRPRRKQVSRKLYLSGEDKPSRSTGRIQKPDVEYSDSASEQRSEDDQRDGLSIKMSRYQRSRKPDSVAPSDTDVTSSSIGRDSQLDQAWDGYQDPPYTINCYDEDEEKLDASALLQTDWAHRLDDDDEFLLSTSHTSAHSEQNAVKRRTTVKSRNNIHYDSDTSDAEDLENVVADSRRALQFTRTAVNDARQRTPFNRQSLSEERATCQTNIDCLSMLLDALYNGRSSSADVDLLIDLQSQWRQLVSQLDELQAAQSTMTSAMTSHTQPAGYPMTSNVPDEFKVDMIQQQQQQAVTSPAITGSAARPSDGERLSEGCCSGLDVNDSSFDATIVDETHLIDTHLPSQTVSNHFEGVRLRPRDTDVESLQSKRRYSTTQRLRRNLASSVSRRLWPTVVAVGLLVLLTVGAFHYQSRIQLEDIDGISFDPQFRYVMGPPPT